MPRASLNGVKGYAQAARRGDFPVSIDTFWSECWIDFRPGSQFSYLTHREVRILVPTRLFAPSAAPSLGQEIAALDPCTLLHLYGAVGVARRKGVPETAREKQVPVRRPGRGRPAIVQRGQLAGLHADMPFIRPALA